jgi:hypothetical protein
MLTFVEAGTEQAADLGAGDESYFAALEHKVDAIVQTFSSLSTQDRDAAIARLVRVRDRAAGRIGWGYPDFLDDVVGNLSDRSA